MLYLARAHTAGDHGLLILFHANHHHEWSTWWIVTHKIECISSYRRGTIRAQVSLVYNVTIYDPAGACQRYAHSFKVLIDFMRVDRSSRVCRHVLGASDPSPTLVYPHLLSPPICSRLLPLSSRFQSPSSSIPVPILRLYLPC